MIQTTEDFCESVQYELKVLSQLFPLFTDEMGTSLDLREAIQGTGPAKVGMNAVFKMGGEDKSCQGILAPLAFLSSWKVIDLLIELALADGGFKPEGRRNAWPIGSKVELAGRAPGNQLFGISVEVWHAICSAYKYTEEHRHCLVHRKASFTEQPLRLTGRDRRGRDLQPLDEQELHAFVHLAQLLGIGLIEGAMSERSKAQLCYVLQQLCRHTGFELPRGVPLGPAVSVYMCLQPCERRELYADFAYVHRKIARTMSAYLADVWIDVPNEAGYRLFGHLERIPSEKVTIELDALPPYLSRI